MKKRVKIRLDKETLRRGVSTARRVVTQLPDLLLVQYNHWLDMAGVAVVLLMAAYLLVRLLYLAPSGVVEPPRSDVTLETNRIDRLELWIEERESERVRPLVVSDPAILEPEEGTSE